MSPRGRRTVFALALQAAALVLLGLALLGVSWLDARARPRVLVLVDRSLSMPRAVSEQALAEVVRAADAAGAGELRVIDFAGRASIADTPGVAHGVAQGGAQGGAGAAGLEPATTNIEGALQAALAAHADGAFARLVVVSDGHENVGDAARALRAARQARLPVQWIAVGRAPPPTRIAEVLAPERARIGQVVGISVQLAGQLDKALRVRATARAPGGQAQALSLPSAGADRVSFEFDASRAGALIFDVTLEDAQTGQVLDGLTDAAVVDVAPRAAILYAQGSGGALARSLVLGGWALHRVPPARLDAEAEALDGYQAVVLDDIAIADAGPRFWRALVAAVTERGLGLMVLGGERSFARGGYRGSTLEQVLPLASEPAALDQPVSIVFAVDKSGSMGLGSGGVDRFALAQRAVLETARDLGARDALGLVVFDVAPRVLIPLAPAPAGNLALARDWQASPGGGTKLAPALEAAIRELERAPGARRMLVLVSDGFIDEAPLVELRQRLDRARIETIALAIGPDADVAALQRVAGAETGVVLRVNQAAELPLVMRSGVAQRRARVARGTIAVTQVQPLPFPAGVLRDWPAIAAHSLTRPQPQATVALQTQSGDPLLAFQSVGRGRVVALASGLGPWTPRWLPWREWPRLAGGLAEWVAGAPPGGAGALVVRDLPAGLQIEAEVDAVAGASIAVDTPKVRGRVVATEPIAPGRLQALLPDDGPGLYTLVVATPRGTQRHLHLRRQRTESAAWGTNPALDTWRAEGLLSRWEPGRLIPPADVGRTAPAPDRTLIGLALALVLAGVLVDRTTLDRSTLGRLLQRWSGRAVGRLRLRR